MSEDSELTRAAAIIRSGGLVAFPTETVYGLGANALDPVAIARIYQAKERPATSPLIVHVSDIAMAQSIAAEWPPLADLLARRFWPGPLTIVLLKTAAVPDNVTAGLPSVGIRIPSNHLALELIRCAQTPIAAPSANRFMQISPTTAAHVRDSLGDRVDMILDGGPTIVGIESTVVSLVRDKPTVLRPGMISIRDLEQATGTHWTMLDEHSQSSESPGLHRKHYAPATQFFILGPGQPLPGVRGRILQMPDDPARYAGALYAELHKADSEGWDWIAVNAPPDEPEWAGIRDRLQRAAAAV
jgi:L-threonylcarbamoyladenylate synthase